MKENGSMSWESLVLPSELQILLIRHGRTAGNIQGRFVGRTDMALDDVGLSQATKLGARFEGIRVDKIYSSPLTRAVQTASVIGQPVVLEGLQELDQGILEGKKFDELPDGLEPCFEAWKDDPESTRIPGGETLGECRDRAWDSMQQIISASSLGERVVVVAHQMVIASILLTAMNKPIRLSDEIKQKNTSISHIRYVDGKLSVVSVGDISHLD
jgi:broad specificity phosphatase PhoE